MENYKVSGDYVWNVRMYSQGHLDYWIMDYFDGLNISHEDDGNTLLTAVLPDISALYGLILHLRDTGVDIISMQVERM